MAPSRPVSGRAVTMLRRMGAAALLLGAGLQGAAAQGYSWGYGPEDVYGAPRAVYRAEPALSPRAVADSLQDRGFTEVGRPRFDGRTYVVDATGPRGARLRLVVDARDGAVIGREVVGEAYYPTAIRPRPVAPGYGWTEEDGRSRRIREAEALVPPADIPSAAPAPIYRGPALGEGRVRTERAPSRPSLPRQQANAADAGIAPQIAPRPTPTASTPTPPVRTPRARRRRSLRRPGLRSPAPPRSPRRRACDRPRPPRPGRRRRPRRIGRLWTPLPPKMRSRPSPPLRSRPPNPPRRRRPRRRTVRGRIRPPTASPSG